MPVAVYPGSLDPITFGHVAAIQDAAEAFGEVIVALGVNPRKPYVFTVEEREKLVKMATRHIPGVRVVSFSGLLVHYLARNDLQIVVRGLRNGQDFHESLLQDTIGWQQDLANDVKVFYVPSKSGQQFTSSTALKVVLQNQGQAGAMAPLSSIQAIQGRMLGQYVYSVTGASGAGKSFICQKFAEIAQQRGIPLVHIDLDRIAHEILSDASEPLYVKARREVGRVFGDEVMHDDESIDRKALGALVFGDMDKLAQLNAILHEPIFFNLHDKMRGKAGLFLLDAALLAESGRTHLSHNHVLLVEAGDDVRAKRLAARDGLSDEQIARRMDSQFSGNAKAALVEQAIEATRYGAVDRIANDGTLTDDMIVKAFETMLARVDMFGDLLPQKTG